MTDPSRKTYKHLKGSRTSRGFVLFTFIDGNDAPCSLQESSSCRDEALLWLGISNEKATLSVHPRVHAPEPNGSGRWEKLGEAYPGIQEVVGGRMHLTQEMAGELARKLEYFSRTGRLRAPRRPKSEEETSAND